MQAEEVVASIRDAFADAVRPAQLTSGPIGSLVDELSRFELLRVFTPEAFRCFLPGFLVAVSLAAADSTLTTDAVVSNLSPPSDNSFQERARFEACVGPLTAAQKEAVRQFLRFIAERDAEENAIFEGDEEIETPQRALDRYWSQI